MNLCDSRHIRATLTQHGFHFSKARGQNFLVDASVPERMAALTDRQNGVLEVGPGFGALTDALCGRAGRVAAIEVDKRLIPILTQNLNGHDNLTILEADALRTDLNALALREFVGLCPMVVSNLPYSLTSDLLQTFIRADAYRTIIVMVQKEVAQRLCAAPGTSAYGSFTIFCRVFCQPEILFDVPPESFMPRPAVDSSVIRLTRRAAPLVEASMQKRFFSVTRSAFSQRRKTLSNALLSLSGLDRPALDAALTAAGINPGLRGETLSIEQFLSITRELWKGSCQS